MKFLKKTIIICVVLSCGVAILIFAVSKYPLVKRRLLTVKTEDHVGVIAVRLHKALHRAMESQEPNEIDIIALKERAINEYRIQVRSSEVVPKDAWGNAIEVELIRKEEGGWMLRVRSPGPDGRQNSADDIARLWEYPSEQSGQD